MPAQFLRARAMPSGAWMIETRNPGGAPTGPAKAARRTQSQDIFEILIADSIPPTA
jgi:hypothetical protein